MTWQAIWSDQRAHLAPPTTCDKPLRNMTLWLELICPRINTPRRNSGLAKTAPLRLWKGASEDNRAVSIYLMADGALRLVHGEIDICTAPDTLRTGETIGLRYTTCIKARSDGLEVTNYDRDTTQTLRSGMPTMATLRDALPASEGYLSVSHVAAVASSIVQDNDLPGIEAGGLVDTAEGPRRVEDLRPGDHVLDSTGTAHPLRWIQPQSRLCLGRKAPILLRAPYFDLEKDLIVTPQTRVLRTGPVVEYQCGTDAVLVTVRDMLQDQAAVRAPQKPISTFYHMLLDDPACIRINNCAFETARLSDMMQLDGREIPAMANPFETEAQIPLPVLDRSAARALVAAHLKAA